MSTRALSGEIALELEEPRAEVERADARALPRVLVRMTALALLVPELKQYLPDAETAERWITAERKARLEIVRRYAFALSRDSVVVKYFRWKPLDSTYEYFALVEVQPPVNRKEIVGTRIFDHRTRASIEVLDKKEFIERYKGRRLMAVVHIAAPAGEEYFIEEFSTEDPAALASAIERLLDNPEMAKEMGLRARRRVEELYRWNKIVRYMRYVYWRVLEEYAASGWHTLFDSLP